MCARAGVSGIAPARWSQALRFAPSPNVYFAAASRAPGSAAFRSLVHACIHAWMYACMCTLMHVASVRALLTRASAMCTDSCVQKSMRPGVSIRSERERERGMLRVAWCTYNMHAFAATICTAMKIYTFGLLLIGFWSIGRVWGFAKIVRLHCFSICWYESLMILEHFKIRKIILFRFTFIRIIVNWRFIGNW